MWLPYKLRLPVNRVGTIIVLKKQNKDRAGLKMYCKLDKTWHSTQTLYNLTRGGANLCVKRLACCCHISCGGMFIGLVPLLALNSKPKIGRVLKWIENWPKLGIAHMYDVHFPGEVITSMSQAFHVAAT